jgi:hypothetical protein
LYPATRTLLPTPPSNNLVSCYQDTYALSSIVQSCILLPGHLKVHLHKIFWF